MMINNLGIRAVSSVESGANHKYRECNFCVDVLEFRFLDLYPAHKL